MSTQLAGANAWEQALYDHIVAHEENERELLVEYQQAANELDSPAFRYLVSLIVEDEIRHHRLLRELAGSLQVDAGTHPGDPAVPRLGNWGHDPRRVVELSDRLVAHEEMDRQQLHRLSREMDPVRDTTLWALLIKMMELDTAKHTEVLNFIRRQARATVP
jgi:hypothetical protein